MSRMPTDAGKSARVREMFARIVPRYDLMNRLMTFGQDTRWRRLAASLAVAEGGTALDVACGTGDLAFELLRAEARTVVGVDFCPEMLDVAREKAARQGGGGRFVAGDALRLPFADAAFDAVTIGFGLRNFADVSGGLGEMARVLRPGGHLVCLEMTHPPFRPFGWAFRPYFHYLVPAVGGLVSGDLAAYRYLPASVDAFPGAPALAGLIAAAGFREIRYRYLALGAVAIHVARRISASDPVTPRTARGAK